VAPIDGSGEIEEVINRPFAGLPHHVDVVIGHARKTGRAALSQLRYLDGVPKYIHFVHMDRSRSNGRRKQTISEGVPVLLSRTSGLAQAIEMRLPTVPRSYAIDVQDGPEPTLDRSSDDCWRQTPSKTPMGYAML